MKKWLILASCAALFVGIQTLRADPTRNCAGGHVVFGRVSCSVSSNPENLLEAYFLGATSMDEVAEHYADRLERFRGRCLRKGVARDLASNVKFEIATVESCQGGRGYQEPCTKNADCIENFCHPDRGTCSAVFTVPITAAH